MSAPSQQPQFVEPWSADQGAARARAGFTAAFGGQPAGVWAAPGRVNLIGEHTDYNGGLALPIALPHRTYLAASVSPDDVARLASVQDSDQLPVHSFPLAEVAPGAVAPWGSYAVGVTWALRRRGVEVPALTGLFDSCVPFGAGLSSSAALEAAFALPSQDLRSPAGPPLDRAFLAAACVEAENLIAGAATGGMDQAAALQSVAGTALMVDSRSGAVEPVPFDLAQAGLELLVIDSRVQHAHAGGEYGSRRATCREAAKRLGLTSLREIGLANLPHAIGQLGGPQTLAARRLRHVVTEIARTEDFIEALRAGRLAALGPLLDASHASLRDDYEVSAPGLDLAVEAARAAGALGARMTGGGFGGSAIALVEAGSSDAVAGAVAGAFAQAGFPAPLFLRAEAAGPAERVA
ncbi:MAG: galactokinase [Bifidobacteriaceae bacterium]|jgi:galactokinase|nr:galactokinase [Bifidobacteriaceae bacterium]